MAEKQMSTFATLAQSFNALYSTLHLLHHRNRNQHRLSKWYISFSQFRRQILNLVKEIDAYDAARKLSTRSKFTREAEERLRARVALLAGGEKGAVSRGMVGDWYLAFSTVVADNQYATLGLMLFGSLARFQSLLVDLGSEIGVEVDLDVGNEVEISGGQEPLLVLAERETNEDDLGEVIEREALERLSDVKREDSKEGKIKGDNTGGGAADPQKRKKRKQVIPLVETERSDEQAPAKPVKKKRRKKGDAFDDLFGSLM